MAERARMKVGLHVAERSRLSHLGPNGLVVPEPWMGILDCLRMIEGHLPEPAPNQPLGIVGLDALLNGMTGDSTTMLQAVRKGLVHARRYFNWKEIPVVVLLDGRVVDAEADTGLALEHGTRQWSLAPLLGTRLRPVLANVHGWWWAPQIG